MDAEKVKKRLNGAILKGKKVKVEEARPKKRRHNDTIEDDKPVAEESSPRRSKRSKKDINTLAAHEISPDRKVKRGWTESKTEKTKKQKKEKSDAKLQAPSKYTEKEELLFKTKIPSNKKNTKTKDSKKEKKDKSGADIIHEFKHTTTVPSFLRDSKTSGAKPAAEYKDGQGWVDDGGNIVEEETGRASRRRKAAKLGLEIDVDKAQLLNHKPSGKKPLSPPPSKHTSSSTVPSSDQSSDETEDVDTDIVDADETSSSGTSSSSEASESESESDAEMAENTPQAADSIVVPPAQEVHPLEALFKKPNIPSSNQSQNSKTSSKEPEIIKPSLELNTTFSFFEQGASDDEKETEVNHELPTMPVTPFSSQDFRSRTMRSAAPTPDTADPRKSKGYASFMLGQDSTDESEEEDDHDDDNNNNNDKDEEISSAEQVVDEDSDDNAPTPTQHSQPQTQSLPESDFSKKFWETRGENNRAWKTRRRVVLKENRQRENRSRRPKTW